MSPVLDRLANYILSDDLNNCYFNYCFEFFGLVYKKTVFENYVEYILMSLVFNFIVFLTDIRDHNHILNKH